MAEREDHNHECEAGHDPAELRWHFRCEADHHDEEERPGELAQASARYVLDGVLAEDPVAQILHGGVPAKTSKNLFQRHQLQSPAARDTYRVKIATVTASLRNGSHNCKPRGDEQRSKTPASGTRTGRRDEHRELMERHKRSGANDTRRNASPGRGDARKSHPTHPTKCGTSPCECYE